MKHIKFGLLAFPVALGLALAGCSASQPSAGPASTGKIVIGISVKTITNDPFQAAWVKAAEAKVKELGGEAEILTAGGQTAIANQVSQLNDLVAKKVTGIIVSPLGVPWRLWRSPVVGAGLLWCGG